jgi:hypothetical protein
MNLGYRADDHHRGLSAAKPSTKRRLSLLLEPQNIEQGMSNVEGHELTDQIATKNANIQEVYETANSRDRNQSPPTPRVFVRLSVAISSFFLRHSLFDIHLFVFRLSLESCQKNKLSRICRTELPVELPL